MLVQETEDRIGSDLLILEVLDANSDHFVLVDFCDFGVNLVLDPVDHMFFLLFLESVFNSNLEFLLAIVKKERTTIIGIET